MTQEQVTASWGRPQRVKRNVYSFGVYEQWIYGGWYLNFKNGILTTHKMKKTEQQGGGKPGTDFVMAEP